MVTRAKESNVPASFERSLLPCDQLPQPRGVHEPDFLEVEHDAMTSLIEQSAERLAEILQAMPVEIERTREGGMPQRELAGQLHDRNGAFRPDADSHRSAPWKGIIVPYEAVKTTVAASLLFALGHKYGVKTIVTGELAVSNVRPDVTIDSLLRSGSVTAQIDATLEVLMYETESGAALWNRSGRTTQSVGQVQIWGGRQLAFDARDPETAYGGLVDDLVGQVSRPFQVTWVRP